MDSRKHKHLQEVYSFGAFRLDVAERRLWKEDEVVSLASKQFDLLLYFVENAGRVARKGDLLDAVWPETYIEETTLARNVSWLRKILENGDGQQIIETVPKVGYRFAAEVELEETGEELFIIDEQTVQHIRGEETLTISAPVPEEITRPALKTGSRPDLTHLLVPALGVLLLTALSLLVYQFVFKSREAKAVVALNVAPLTSATGFEDAAVFSPDGKFVAYAWNGGKGGEYGDKNIYVKAVKTGEPRQLTSTDANEHYPVFSPDGLHIAFVRGKWGTPGEVIIIPFLGGAERRIATVFSGNYSISFSPDGEHIAVIDTADSKDGSQYAVYTIDIKTGERRRVTAPAEFEGETTPRFSPDGKQIAFVRIASTDDKQQIVNQDIFIVAADGGKPKQLTFDKAGINSLAWNAAGDQIFFVSARADKKPGAWAISVSGGEPAIVSTGGKDVRSIALSPDGKKLLFSERYRKRFIWRATSNGEPARRLTESENDQFYPQISPDGLTIAYHSGFGEAGDAQSDEHIQIWLADADGRNPRRITEGPYPGRNPQFSPDGTRIAFNSALGKESVNYTIAKDGGGLRRISPAGWYDEFPVWDRTGEYIFFVSKHSGEKNIWKTRADGSGEPVQITRGGAYRAFPTPDGKYLFYIKEKFDGQFLNNKDFAEQMWRVSAEGGVEEPMPEFATAGFYGIFTMGSKGVYFLSADADGKPILKVYDFADGKIRNAPGEFNIPDEIDREFIFKDVINTNGDVLLFTVATHTSRVMMADLL